MNALAYQIQENEVSNLSVVPRTDLSKAFINTLVPNFMYKDQFGLPKKVKTENQFKL